MVDDEVRKIVLEDARADFKRDKPTPRGKWKFEELKQLNSQILQLMQEGVSIGSIWRSINRNTKIKVSKTTLRRFMEERFTDIYKSNYSINAPQKAVEGSRKKREKEAAHGLAPEKKTECSRLLPEPNKTRQAVKAKDGVVKTPEEIQEIIQGYKNHREV